MRYKFRGKRVDNGEWVYGDLHYGEEPERVVFIFDYTCWSYIAVIPETVGMWVGLIDKNNKEIYEGDILSWKYAGMEEEFFFVEDIFSVYREKVKYAKRHMDDWHLPSIAKVIGNKWDNPGLLKGGKEDYHGKKA